MASTAPAMTRNDWAILLALAVLWGGSFFFIHLAVRDIPPFTLVLVRVTLASAALWLALRATGGRLPRDLRIWGALLAMALLNSVIPWSLVAAAQTAIPSGLASILNALTPIWGVLAAHLLTSDEKATPNRIAGVGFGFAGVVALIGPEAFKGLGSSIVPELACVAAALSYAFAGVYGRRFKTMGLTPLQTATGQLAMAALALLPVSLVVDMPWRLPMPGATAALALVSLALVCTALAFVLFFRLLASAGATNAMLVTFLIPITAILLGSIFLGEALSPQHLVGMALIALGLVAVDGRLPRAAWVVVRAPPPPRGSA
jgi:drug/metabolite transporter (DMT)-like permease